MKQVVLDAVIDVRYFADIKPPFFGFEVLTRERNDDFQSEITGVVGSEINSRLYCSEIPNYTEFVQWNLGIVVTLGPTLIFMAAL